MTAHERYESHVKQLEEDYGTPVVGKELASLMLPIIFGCLIWLLAIAWIVKRFYTGEW